MCFHMILFAGNQLLTLLGNYNILLSEHSTIALTFTSAYSFFYTSHIYICKSKSFYFFVHVQDSMAPVFWL